jgi:hypothetical protein
MWVSRLAGWLFEPSGRVIRVSARDAAVVSSRSNAQASNAVVDFDRNPKRLR